MYIYNVKQASNHQFCTCTAVILIAPQSALLPAQKGATASATPLCRF